MNKYSVVDLFCGAGGLSLGFTQTDKFTVVAAVENNKFAQETYTQNNKNIMMFSDVRDVVYSDILNQFSNIDVVIGGPPCQGFSNANRQRNQLVNMNNQLVKEYVRAIRELRPRAFVMENVKMLKSEVHRFYYTKRDAESGEIEKYGIPTEDKHILLLDEKYSSDFLYEVSQNIDQYMDIVWTQQTYLMLNLFQRYAKNPKKLLQTYRKYLPELQTICNSVLEKRSCISAALDEYYRETRCLANGLSKFGLSENIDDYLPHLEKLLSIQRMLTNISELRNKGVEYKLISDNGIRVIVKSYSVCDYITRILQSPEYNYKIKTGILNAADYGVPQKRQRFIMLGIRDCDDTLTLPPIQYVAEHYHTVRDVISDLETVPVHVSIHEGPEPAAAIRKTKAVQRKLCNSDQIFNHTITDTRQVALDRFAALKEGQNFHDLSPEMKQTYTDADKTQNTVYLRLKYDEPSGTVLNVRKSMWIHPTLNRAVSIREAARLQTFPDSFVFYGTKDAQYQQIGNAVPPMLGEAIAEHLTTLLRKNKKI